MGRQIIFGGYHLADEKMATLQLSSSCHLTERSWMESLSHVCTTTPCPTTGWPLVTWKGSGVHVPLSVLAA
ncbi:unnamed protein product [Spirodela intermedia]|uniref:Uncharacterized protein n=1 Tax=Spirodela intermedia TaxID=51605 RepID=A0A7I8KYC1_SPIIN|nr:unnamed protein product [Spirodela intermedia]